MNKTLIYPYANYLTPLKYRGTTDSIIHLINHIRTCRKQISAKLRTADIFAFQMGIDLKLCIEALEEARRISFGLRSMGLEDLILYRKVRPFDLTVTCGL